MSNPETILLQQIRLALGEIPGVIMYRNSLGFDTRAHAYYGIGHDSGGSDLIGFTVRGRTAVFTAIECKTATGIVSDDQRRFINVVRSNGGYAGIARSVEDAISITQGFIHD